MRPSLRFPPQTTPSCKIQNCKTLAYIIGTFIYLIIGATIFDKLESSHEDVRRDHYDKNISLFQRQHNMSRGDFDRLTSIILKNHQYKKKQWQFIGSFYYSTVVLTLIGYGHATPTTSSGKAVTIAYALIGIPMSLIMFQSVGERLNSLITYCLKRLKRRFKKSEYVTDMELLTCEALLSVLTLLTGAYMFYLNEKWSYLSSLYYCLLTLTTIGFGDFVPLQQKNYNEYPYVYIFFTIGFILTGLTILASSSNLLVLKMVETDTNRIKTEQTIAHERRMQAVHLVGDVISANGRLITLEETPSESMTQVSESISLCSCTWNQPCTRRQCCCFVLRKHGRPLEQISCPQHQHSSPRDEQHSGEMLNRTKIESSANILTKSYLALNQIRVQNRNSI
ncbi:unnamed protein product [Didymodactylos carnosus]|uniref:Potassium channel domain-containing protein n=1 Tax=Didymodactylos carnosus TaxID=1234261 RepID=A0A815AXV3_9BILA|nr:unnamed protein product [Didymodactylos carnosus]CAF1262685.1 unnamed protein product [Didymodactylos carnosus]CAF3858311.1 unnamed protein product [Didymodactylos carnosus]CAF4042052.1 unnamed protein product [Didymodactylos carnosus]